MRSLRYLYAVDYCIHLKYRIIQTHYDKSLSYPYLLIVNVLTYRLDKIFFSENVSHPFCTLSYTLVNLNLGLKVIKTLTLAQSVFDDE